MSSRVVALFVLGACSYSPPGESPTPDAKADAAVDAPVSDLHLAITEICVEGTVEFIEIHNPTDKTIDLSTYYLTDANEYWRRPGLPAETIPVISSDFLVRFPDGDSIAPGAVIVVASVGGLFEVGFGMPPTYSIDASSAGEPMVHVVPPEGTPLVTKLSDEGELLVLFHWDGEADRVTDVDIVVHGLPSIDSNRFAAKQAIDGPDNDTTATPYAVDAMTMSMTARGPDDDRFSYKRVALEAVAEMSSGGNGITGHDETSENLQMTWDTGSMPPTPGTFALP